MELVRGPCDLCGAEDKVIKPPQAERFIGNLEPLMEGHVNKSEFNRIQGLVLVCPKCVEHILILTQIKSRIVENCNSERKGRTCFVCRKVEHNVLISDWTPIETLLGEQYTSDTLRTLICLECLFFVNVLTPIKERILSKYPELEIDKKEAKNHTLGHLTPLKHTEHNLKENVKSDSKFMHQVLYVKLGSSANNQKKTLKRKRNSFSPTSAKTKKVKHNEAITSTPKSRKKRHDITNLLSPSTSDETPLISKKRSLSPAGSLSSPDRTKKSDSESPNSRDESHLKKSFFKIKLSKHRKPRPKSKRKDFILDVRRECLKHNVVRELKVDVVRMDFGRYFKNKVDVSGKKRKSVSFAEEKNVQIEYVEYPKSNVSSRDEKCVAAKKILKKTIPPIKLILKSERKGRKKKDRDNGKVKKNAKIKCEETNVNEDIVANNQEIDDNKLVKEDSDLNIVNSEVSNINKSDLSQENLNESDVIQENVNQSELSQENLNQSELSQENVNQSELSQEQVNQSDLPEQETTQTDESDLNLQLEKSIEGDINETNTTETPTNDINLNLDDQKTTETNNDDENNEIINKITENIIRNSSPSPDIFEGFPDDSKMVVVDTAEEIPLNDTEDIENDNEDIENDTNNVITNTNAGLIGLSDPIVMSNGLNSSDLPDEIISPQALIEDIPKDDDATLIPQTELGDLDTTLTVVAENGTEIDGDGSKSPLVKDMDSVPVVGVSELSVSDDLLGDGNLRLGVLPEEIMEDGIIK